MPPATDLGRPFIPRGVPPQASVQSGSLALALVAAIALAGLLAQREARLALLLVIGLALGAALYHSAFGFTAAYRRLLVDRDTAGAEAQLLMLAVATVLFVPALAMGSLFGRPVAGATAPLSAQVAFGAFIFGIGMQLANGCGSGTLYTIGGGSTRMVVALVTFCLGGFWASLHFTFWEDLPSLGEVVLVDELGVVATLALQLGLLAVLWWIARGWRKPPAEGRRDHATKHAWLRGPWPLAVGAVVLALLNFATLAVAGHPWSITWAFTLWAAKTAQLVGWQPDGTAFWREGFARQALDDDLLADITSVMDIAIVIGALAAAALAGRLAPSRRLTLRSLAAAAIGGLLMGYGARIAFGCNVGAFFSGVASTSLHGWLWIVMALGGTWIGVRWRPYFGLAN